MSVRANIPQDVLVPISVGGLGVRESSFSGLLKHAGATAA